MRVLYIEPFDGGSHASFGKALTAEAKEGGLSIEWTRLTLPARHWKWRMRGSAAYFARSADEGLMAPHDLIFASSYFPLAEFLGLCPKLAGLPSVLYFHENQLAFPTRSGEALGRSQVEQRDLHYGFTQLVSASAATRCVFNSDFNRRSFLDEARRLLARMPDAIPPGWVDSIEAKSCVLPLPLDLPEVSAEGLGDLPGDDPVRSRGPLIVWNHRWEHDKGPEAFFKLLFRLAEGGVPFRLAVCGHRFRRHPEIFDEAETRLSEHIVQWGSLASRDAYLEVLAEAQIVLSTAAHEFFGISMVEATHYGARPWVPDRLAYPEIFPEEYRYADEEALFESLRSACWAWTRGERDLRCDRQALTEGYRANRVRPRYGALFDALVGSEPR